MELSVSFMSNVIGILALLLYMCAPFLHDAKRAFYARLLSELLFGMMFFYIGCLAGTVYYVFMILSGLFEKQIEHNAIHTLRLGILSHVGMAVTDHRRDVRPSVLSQPLLGAVHRLLLNVKRKDFSFPAGQSAQKRGVPSVSRRGINAECTGLYKILQHIMHE